MENKLSWNSPTFADLEKISFVAEINNQFGNEMSAANLFLYRNKYQIKIAFYDGIFFRKYFIDGKSYFSLPLICDESILKSPDYIERKKQKILHGIEILKSENPENAKTLDLFYVYESDLELLKTAFHGKLQDSLDEKHFDYIYLRENLDNLSGSKYQKKRNHISRFLRSFPQADFQPLSKENLEEAWKVEELWFESAKSQSELSDSESLEQEYLIIKEALENFEKLNLSGGIVYIEKNPVAMTVASKINSRIMDIHFEKALMPFAFEGAYSFINNQFAKTKDFELFNREEDLGLEGLKKAKLSYYPEQILKKWFVKIEL